MAAACWAAACGDSSQTTKQQLLAGGGGALCEVTNDCQIAAVFDANTGACAISTRDDGSACEDHNPCRTNTTCKAGQCQGGTALADATACDDGQVCTTGTTCKQGLCQGGSNLPDGSACDDINVCTDGTTCLRGLCQGGSTLACPAKDSCHVDGACDAVKGCIDEPMQGPCHPALPALGMQGCCSSTYSVPVQLGAQSYQLLVDSGSTTVAVAGDACQEGCDGLSPLYPAPAANSKARVSARYGDGSAWVGQVTAGKMALPNVAPATDLNFAVMDAASQQSGGFTPFFLPSYCNGSKQLNTLQGILGMGGKGLAAKGSDAIMDVLSANGFYDAFATQMCNVGGRMWVGGYDPAFMAGKPVFTPMDASDGYYRVGLIDIRVGSHSLNVPASAFAEPVVDTGASSMQFPDPVQKALANILANDANFTRYFKAEMLADAYCTYPKVSGVSRHQLNQVLPPLTFRMPKADGPGSFDVTLPATASYLTLAITPKGDQWYCTTFLSNQTGGTLAGSAEIPSIIGNAAMRSHVLIFDRQQKRLGFAPQRNCVGEDL